MTRGCEHDHAGVGGGGQQLLQHTPAVHCLTAAVGQIIITDILSARLSSPNAVPIKHASKFFRCPANPNAMDHFPAQTPCSTAVIITYRGRLSFSGAEEGLDAGAGTFSADAPAASGVGKARRKFEQVKLCVYVLKYLVRCCSFHGCVL